MNKNTIIFAKKILTVMIITMMFSSSFATAKIAQSGIKKQNINTIRNGGFEKETNPGHVDVWGPFYWNLPGRGETSSLMDLKSFITVDRKQAYEGKQSLRIIVPDKMNEINIQHPYIRRLPNNKDAVFSIYMKSVRNQEGKVSLTIRPLAGGPWVQKSFNLSSNWKRYELKFQTPKKGGIQPWVKVKDGIVWLDAAKLELGIRATPFVSEKPQGKSTTSAKNTMQKVYNIPILPQAPPMNGDLKNDFWKNALEFKTFYHTKSMQALKANKTIAKMAISATTLYLAFECFGKNSPARKKKRDSNVWADDSIEFFLDPGSPPVMNASDSQGSYYHFAVNSFGTVFDMLSGGIKRPFNAKIKTLCKRYENKWIAQIAIDLSSLNISKLEQNWRFNICREDHTNKQYSSVFPVKYSFHSYNDFGYGKITEQLYRKLTNISVKKVQVIPNGGVLLQFNCKENPGKVSAVLKILDRNKVVFKGKWQGTAKAGNNRYIFPGKLVPGYNLTARVNITAADGSKLYKKLEITNDKVAMFRQNYYTVEKEAELIWRNIPALPQRGKFTFGKHLVPYQTIKGKIMVDISKVPSGKYKIKIASRIVPFTKLSPRPNAVKIDQDKNSLIVDGKTYIFYGSYIRANPKSKYLMESYSLPYLKKIGFNGVSICIKEGLDANDKWSVKNRIWDVESYLALMDACSRNGLKVIIYLSMAHHRKAGFKTIFTLKNLIPKMKDHPALLAWYIADEPTPKSNKEIWQRYNYVRKTDPYHPVMVNVTSRGLALDVTVNKAGKHPFDIYSLTYYPVGCTMHSDTEIGLKIGDMLFKQMFVVSKKCKGVMIHAAQAYGYGTDYWDREPTPAEVSFLVYMPMIYGNRGWNWFGGRTKCRETWDAVIAYGHEVKKLAPILADSEKVNDDSVISSSCGKAFGLLRKLGESYYFITVNKTQQTIKTNFNLSEYLPEGFKKAEVLFENRQVQFGKSKTYMPYQRHVYKITK
jgi:Carbohydrate family 9 binding domain-like